MICVNCGNQIPEGSQFCTNCGQPLINNEIKQEETNEFSQLNNPVENTFSYSNVPEEPKKSISSKRVLKVVVIVIGLLFIIAIPFLWNMNLKKQIKNISGLEVFIPSNFTLQKDDNYDALYENKKEGVFIGIKTFSARSLDAGEYFGAYIETMEGMGVSCDVTSTKAINLNKWKYTKCNSKGASSYIYLTEKTNKFYLLVIAFDKGKETNYLNKLEKHLDFSKK